MNMIVGSISCVLDMFYQKERTKVVKLEKSVPCGDAFEHHLYRRDYVENVLKCGGGLCVS